VTTVFWAPLKKFFRCYTSSVELGLLLCGFIKLLPNEISPDNSSFGSKPCHLLFSSQSWNVLDRQLIICAELCLIFKGIWRGDLVKLTSCWFGQAHFLLALELHQLFQAEFVALQDHPIHQTAHTPNHPSAPQQVAGQQLLRPQQILQLHF